MLRISKTADFRRVYREGRLFRGGVLWAYRLPTPDDKIRLGISVSQGIDKRSTTRNRIKRIIRGWFCHNHDMIEPGSMIVVSVKKAVLPNRSGSRLIQKELHLAFDRQRFGQR